MEELNVVSDTGHPLSLSGSLPSKESKEKKKEKEKEKRERKEERKLCCPDFFTRPLPYVFAVSFRYNWQKFRIFAGSRFFEIRS